MRRHLTDLLDYYINMTVLLIYCLTTNMFIENITYNLCMTINEVINIYNYYNVLVEYMLRYINSIIEKYKAEAINMDYYYFENTC